MTISRRLKQERSFADDLQDLKTLNDQLRFTNAKLQARISGIGNDGKKITRPTPLLALDFQLTVEEYETIIAILVEAVGGNQSKPAILKDLFIEYPLVFLAALSGTAMLDAQEGFWPAFWKRTQVSVPEHVYDAIRKELVNSIRKNGLETFSLADLNRREYVGLIQLHSGLSAKDMLALVKFIDHTRAENQGWDSGEDFASYAKSVFSSGDNLLTTESLKQLVTHIPARSVDFIARVYELTNWYRDLKDLNEVEAFVGTHGLPELSFKFLLECLSGEAEQIAEKTKAAPASLENLEPPHLYLDPQSFELSLVFPAISKTAALQIPAPEWTVIYDGNSIKVRPEQDWSYGGFAEYRLPLDKPLSSLRVITPTEKSLILIEGFGHKNPIMFFKNNGQPYANQEMLSGNAVTAIVPAAAIIRARMRASKTFNYQDLGPLSGWNKWVIRSIPLKRAESITVSHGGFRKELPVRRKVDVQWITEDLTIENLQGLDHEPVFHTSPRIEFPTSGSNWVIQYSQILPDGSLIEMEDYPVEPENFGYELDLFEESDDPWVGQFLVTLLKDEKVYETRKFNLAEGLDLSLTFSGGGPENRFRYPSINQGQTGLTKTFARFSSNSEKHIRFPDEIIGLDAFTSQKAFNIASGDFPEDYNLDVFITPPQLHYQVPVTHSQTKWESTKTTLDFNDFADGNLQIRFPNEVYDPNLKIIKMVAYKKPESSEPKYLSKIGSSKVWSIPMDRIKELMDDDAQFLLIAEWFAESKDQHREKIISEAKRTGKISNAALKSARPQPQASSHIATIEKKPLLAAAEIKLSTVELELGRHTSKRLKGWAWSALNPLDPPIKVDFQGTSGSLPDTHFVVGPLIVEVREKEFLSQWQPKVPSVKAVVANDPSFELDPQFDPFLTHRWMFAPRSGKVLLPQEIRTVWDARFNMRHVLAQRENLHVKSIQDFDDATSTYLTSDPRVALDELDKSSIPSNSHFESFIRSGLAELSFEVDDTAGDIHRVPWIGLIQEMNDLRILQIQGYETEERAIERRNSQSYIREIGGSELWNILKGNSEGLSLAQKCAPQATEINVIRNSGLEAMRNGLGADQFSAEFISADSRLRAQLEWLENRRELNDLGQLPTLFDFAEKYEYLIDHLGDDRIKVTARELSTLASEHRRGNAENWLYAPYVSFIYSLLNRMIAHEVIRPIAQINYSRHDWANAARLIPRLTGFDLVSAEAKVLSAINNNNIIPTAI